MPQKCKVCSHDETDMINEEIINGAPNRRIAAQFALNEQSIRRHKKNCLSEHLLSSKQIKDLLRADSLVQRILSLLTEAEDILNDMKGRGDLRGAVSSVGELRRIIELLARLGADFAEKQAINIHNDPAWVKIRTLILKTLTDYPDALRAVVIALKGESDEH